MKKTKLKDKIIAASIIGSIMLLVTIGSWISFFKSYSTSVNGVPIVAQVIEIIDTDKTEPERDFYLSYEYEGKTYTFRKNYVVWSDVETGDKIDAFVNPKNPHELAFSKDSRLSRIIIPIISTLCTIAVVFYYFRKSSN